MAGNVGETAIWARSAVSESTLARLASEGMDATPLWLVLTSVLVGPAVTAALITVVGQRGLQKQKRDLDKSLAEHKTALDEAAARRQAEFQTTLSEGLAEQNAVREEAWRRWRDLETWFLDYSADLRRAYALVFDQSPTATADELATLVRQAQDLVMAPYRRRERLLSPDTSRAILDVNNHLGQFLLGSPPAAPEKIARFRATGQDFFTLVERARHAIHDELIREEPRHDRRDRIEQSAAVARSDG